MKTRTRNTPALPAEQIHGVKEGKSSNIRVQRYRERVKKNPQKYEEMKKKRSRKKKKGETGKEEATTTGQTADETCKREEKGRG